MKGRPARSPKVPPPARPYWVKLTRPIALSDREIQWAQFNAYDGGSLHDASQQQVARELPRDEPAFNVSWYHAVSYCRWLTEHAGRGEQDQAYPDPKTLDPLEFARDPDPEAEDLPRNWPVNLERGGIRLPTEAEWEIAARAATSTTFSFGNDDELLERYAWLSVNSN